MKKYVAAACASLFLFSCNESPVTSEAVEYEYDKLLTLPGYSYVIEGKNTYTPKTDVIPQISESFDASTEHIVAFVTPSCTCGKKSDVTFPAIVKTLETAAIPISNVTIFSMSKSSDGHPLKEKLAVTSLPSYFIRKINGTDTSYVNLLAGVNLENTTIEEELLTKIK